MATEKKDRLIITSEELFKVTIPNTGLDRGVLKKLGCIRDLEHHGKMELLSQEGFPTGDMICHFARLPQDHPNGITPIIVLSILEQFQNTVWPHPLLALTYLFGEHFHELDMYNNRYITSVNFYEPWTKEWLMDRHDLNPRWKPRTFEANGIQCIDLMVPVLQGNTKEDAHMGVASPSGLPWPDDTFVFFTKVKN